MSAEPIVIVDYDPRWPALFAAERAALQTALGPRLAAIEHGGSTAVPGLAAKPIIDLFGALRSLAETPDCLAPLAGLGYSYVPEVEVFIPERRYFRKRSAEVTTHHLHLFTLDVFWDRPELAFRDYLRAHPDAAREYAALKRALAARYAHDRPAYTDAKTAYVHDILTRARAQG